MISERPKVLYFCLNDGTDTRIRKELATYGKSYEVYFMGVKSDKKIDIEAKEVFLTKGSHRNLLTIILVYIKLILLLLKKNFDKIHIVDEQIYIVFLPVLGLVSTSKTLDIFDSFFLKINKPDNDLMWLKRVLYGSVDRIFVTDYFRRDLLPRFVHKKCEIIPNVPNFDPELRKKFKRSLDGKLVIGYFGTLAEKRGSSFIAELLAIDNNVEILAAGWIADGYTKDIFERYRERIKWRGVLTQREVNHWLCESADYLLCVYPTNNLNNIYASPNKIYDAIHCRTPVIINASVKVSEFVRENQIGHVYEEDSLNERLLLKELYEKKGEFMFSTELAKKNCWENYEDKFLESEKNMC